MVCGKHVVLMSSVHRSCCPVAWHGARSCSRVQCTYTPQQATLCPFLPCSYPFLPPSSSIRSRLLKTAGRTVELLRSLDSDTPSERLPAHLLLLCHHLIYYAAQGGSTELTSRSSLEQAQEAAKEAAGEEEVLTVLG